MNQLTRGQAPSRLMDEVKMRNDYNNLYDAKGKIRQRWNTMQEKGKKVVREALSAISNGCCAYCGDKIRGSKMDVDHYLPSSVFPYLAYCWENLLPSCKLCNQTYKRDYYPLILENKKIIEHCMVGEVDYDYLYIKHALMVLIKNERIIDPTYDIINDHMTFQPAIHRYDTHSPIGEKTKEIFFQRDEVERELEGISNIVRGLVQNGCSYDIIETHIDVYGREFYYKAYYWYWKKQQDVG